MNEENKFEAWAIIELFGHNQIAGKCTEQNIAGSNMLRVDVPETDEHPPFTRFLGSGSDYRDWETDRKSTRLNSSHITRSRMPSSA